MFEKLLKKYYDASSDDAAAISGSSQVAASAIGAMAQSNLNKKTQQFDVDMYNKQRTDALSDWNRNNAYNAPDQQMARFKAAGLNPNLIYGQGNNGNATPVRSSTVGAWNPKAPDYSGIAQGVGNAMNIKVQQAQLDNMKAQQILTQAQTNNVNADTDNKAATNAGIPIDVASKQFDLQLKQDLRPITTALSATSLDQAKAQLDKTLADTSFTLSSNERADLLNAQTLKQGILNMLNTQATTAHTIEDTQRIQQAIKNAQTSNQIDQYEVQLNKLGLTKHDPYYIRVASGIINGLKGSSKQSLQQQGLNPETGELPYHDTEREGIDSWNQSHQ